ncbi:uroporphyrinogen decarboxylase family protein [Aerococcus sp. UMB7834]|uniref:uroporphyrinogen decarboxylase family protein n=1 Tax=Aerococcus sp. UMB7834 TaxID=3046342 RepID=UPI00255063E5|nr:uroporphyrinogen decarboxylase family protein [Aerococcus sp. UMB7834]MDK6805907.1 uroporphyrinogen decarboxylase family protein [Aerococcus sp. UMB7834]
MALYKGQPYLPARSLDCARPFPAEVLGPGIDDLRTINHWPSCLAALVQKYRQYYRQNYCLLPLNHSLEAEAYGIQVYHDRYLGDRLDPQSKRQLDHGPLGALPLTDNALAASLAACQRLSQRGEKICFNLTGPFTLAEQLYDFNDLLGCARRQPASYQAVMAPLVQGLTRLGQAALDAGASVLALADPTGDRELLGPRHYGQVAGGLQRDLVERLLPSVEARGAKLYLSPGLYRGLAALGWLERGPQLAPAQDFPQLLFRETWSAKGLVTGSLQGGIYKLNPINKQEKGDSNDRNDDIR